MTAGSAKIPVRVAEVVEVNSLIKRFRFVRRDGGAVPSFSGGAHIVVEMDDHGTRRLNPYSLMSDPADPSGYAISVRRDDIGRGGSLFLHNHVVPGTELVRTTRTVAWSAPVRASTVLRYVIVRCR